MQGAISAHSLELNVHHLTVSAWNMGNNIVQVSQLNIFEFIPFVIKIVDQNFMILIISYIA